MVALKIVTGYRPMAIVVLACGVSVRAQVTSGTVRGVVRDQNGAVIPGATVQITDVNTMASQAAQSGSGGEYQFNNLLVGTYTITVQPPAGSNFSTLTVSDVLVKLNEVTDVPTVFNQAECR
jgi:hypothetical protein